MLDPMSALSLAGNIVQFVDFSSKIVSKGRRIYLSAEGALPKNLELEVVANDLSQLAARLRTDGLNKATPSEEETSLKIISDECSKIAKELLKRLDKLKVKSDAKHRGWKSLRQALKSVWNKEELDDLAERLSLFRNQLQTDILFSLKKSIDLQKLQQSARFDSLDDTAKSLLSSLLKNKSIFTTQINSQTVTITDLHLEDRVLIQKEAKQTRTEILEALRTFESTSSRTANPSHPISSSWDKHYKMQDMILQSLRFPTMKDRYEAIDEAHAKTFQWIFEKPDNIDKPWDDFSDWLEHGDGIYWISGKAGSGKSTLMRYIKDNPRLRILLQEWTTQDEDLVIATFFFWISGVSDQSSQVGLLRSLLFELLSSKRHLIEATLPDLWSSLRSSVSPIQYSQTYSWTLVRVTSAFKRLFSIISQGTGHVFLLIDGLDEYEGQPVDTIELLQSVISPNVKICVSSRPWQVFEVAFRETPKLRVQNLTYEDIRRYTNDKLLGNKQMQQLCNVSTSGAPELVDEIVEKADGVFLWVMLVVKSFLNGLTNGDSISYLRKRLEEMPGEIENLYSYMLKKIEPIYFEEGRNIFSVVWLAFHTEQRYDGGGICALLLSCAIEDKEDLKAPARSLSLEEVISKVAWVDSRLKVCCAGLLEMSGLDDPADILLGEVGNRRVQFIHRTARDFLAPESTPGQAHKKAIAIRPAITNQIIMRMMRATVTYLRSCVVLESPIISREAFLNPLVRRMMWLAFKAERAASCHHTEIAELLDAVKDSAELFPMGMKWSDLVQENWTIARPTPDYYWFDDFLSLAIMWRLNAYLERKLGPGNQVLDAKPGRPYLDYALRHNDAQIKPQDWWDLKTISILLEHGGNPNQQYTIGGRESLCLTQGTPWEAVLYTTSRYYDHATWKGELFTSLLAPLFEMLLRDGADPYATSGPAVGNRSAASLGVSFAVIVSWFSKICPERSMQLLELWEAARKKSPTPGVMGWFTRLKNVLIFSK